MDLLIVMGEGISDAGDGGGDGGPSFSDSVSLVLFAANPFSGLAPCRAWHDSVCCEES